MALDIIGFTLASSHVLTVVLIILWFGLGKPKSRAQFLTRFKEQMLGIKSSGASVGIAGVRRYTQKDRGNL